MSPRWAASKNYCRHSPVVKGVEGTELIVVKALFVPIDFDVDTCFLTTAIVVGSRERACYATCQRQLLGPRIRFKPELPQPTFMSLIHAGSGFAWRRPPESVSFLLIRKGSSSSHQSQPCRSQTYFLECIRGLFPLALAVPSYDSPPTNLFEEL